MNPLLALAAVAVASAGPAPELYPVPICTGCRPFALSDLVCTEQPRETALGLVSAGNGCVAVAFANAEYGREFLKANTHLAFPDGEGLANFNAKESLKAARAERAKK